jgi:hypothetical protein
MASALERLLEPPKPKLKWYHYWLCWGRSKPNTEERDELYINVVE